MMCIVVDREKLLTYAGMFVYINTCFVSNFRCDSKMAVSSAVLFQICDLNLINLMFVVLFCRITKLGQLKVNCPVNFFN